MRRGNLAKYHTRDLPFCAASAGLMPPTAGAEATIPIGNLRSIGLASGSCLRSRFLLLLLLDFLRVAVEEHIDHDVPAIGGARNGPAEAEHLARKGATQMRPIA